MKDEIAVMLARKKDQTGIRLLSDEFRRLLISADKRMGFRPGGVHIKRRQRRQKRKQDTRDTLVLERAREGSAGEKRQRGERVHRVAWNIAGSLAYHNRCK